MTDINSHTFSRRRKYKLKEVFGGRLVVNYIVATFDTDKLMSECI